MSAETVIPKLLATAWLLPLVGFVIEILGGFWQRDRMDKRPALLAIFCIGAGFVLSVLALGLWICDTGWTYGGEHHAEVSAGHESHDATGHDATDHHAGHAAEHGHNGEHHEDEHAGESDAHAAPARPLTGSLYFGGKPLAQFGTLVISLDYYIDSLTLVMFVMVTLIATCIHIFAVGYMSDELTEDHADHEVHLPGGKHLHRPGRFYRFFAYMSLFSFSMLGLVIAGNIFMVFVFWELVGICSYFLIGFYFERHSASTAANKAFIMNRVGDFGFLVGLMVIWTHLGTFSFGEHQIHGRPAPGLFQMVRGSAEHPGELVVGQDAHGTKHVYLHDAEGHPRTYDDNTPVTIPYLLLTIAGLGVFAGCIGKSAQFPLQTWLPDAMEGPTPVSALVHSATMVAAGVYLAGRFYPMFTPEVLLTIAYVGCITLFLAATIAIVATDIKRVLAYSTISQLGYMMLGIGVAGWAAGLFHLITHAFFKSLMFLCSGSVIIGCHHEQEMTRMGGLRRKMPVTAYTMLVGVIAISGLAIPGLIAFSGYHSKDAIVATALAYTNLNSTHFLLFFVPLVTAGITAFYMFRLWFYTFAGQPRDQELYDHVHESPKVMTVPLLVLAVFAAFCAAGGEQGPLFGLLLNSEPAGVAGGTMGAGMAANLNLPGHEHAHAAHAQAGLMALFVAAMGTVLAYFLYVKRVPDPAEIKKQFVGLHGFLVEKWQFDTLYDTMFTRPVRVVATWCAWIDRHILDAILHGVCRFSILVARWDRWFDEWAVDGLVNLLGDVTYACGRSFRVLQTGRLRQYIMFIAVGVLMLFVLIIVFSPKL